MSALPLSALSRSVAKHIDRATKVGAAACKHCGGAGGGSDWAKTFAAALCEIFDCPPMVEREAGSELEDKRCESTKNVLLTLYISVSM